MTTFIGVDDLLDFLPVFGDEFGNPPEPCDYDGTPLEEFWRQVLRRCHCRLNLH